MTTYAVIPCADVSVTELESVVRATSSVIDYFIPVINSADYQYRQIMTQACEELNIANFRASDQKLGKSEAIRIGLETALRDPSCERICQIDGHLKQAPEGVSQLLKLLSSHELALYSRYRNATYNTDHRATLAPLMAAVVRTVTGTDLSDTVCGTRAYTRRFAQSFLSQSCSVSYGIEIEQVLFAGLRDMKVAEHWVASAAQADNTSAEKLASNFYAVLGSLRRRNFPHLFEVLNALTYAVSTFKPFEFDCSCLQLPDVKSVYFEPIEDGEDGENSYRLRKNYGRFDS